MNAVAWQEELELERRQKDEFLALHPQSPIKLEDRVGLKSLDYFPPNPDCRFVLELYRHDTPDTITVEDTSGGTRQMLRWGEFRFEIDRQQCTLQAYRSDSTDQRLFLPFRDETNGEETYPAGRYIDLEPAHNLRTDGTWVVDLNRAYNPWCAYSEQYACPFVLPENWLKVRIPAGEKAFRANNQ